MVFQALRKVFRKPIYALIALIMSFTMFALAVWLPNISLIVSVMSHSGISFSDKLNLPVSLLGSIATNFTSLSASYTIAIATLFGVNLSMVVYLLRRKVTEVEKNGVATGFLGITSGVLGVGCAACGSLALTSVLAFFGASGALALLPLAGGEFGILGVALLSVSIYLTAKQIQNPAVCYPK